MSRKRIALRVLRLTTKEWTALVAAIVLVGFGAISIVSASKGRSLIEARSALQNCQQIEKIKKLDRGTVQRSLERLPTVAYYRDHPAELAQAIKDTQVEIDARGPVDCYKLPIVRASDLKPPKED